MASSRPRRALKGFVSLLGAVAVVAGATSMVLGVSSVPAPGPVGANVDSEFRFYATWYVAAGVVLLRSARKLDTAGTAIRTVAVAFFAAGCARVVSLFVEGRPHWSQLVLMAIELLMPVILVPWHKAVERNTAGG